MKKKWKSSLSVLLCAVLWLGVLVPGFTLTAAGAAPMEYAQDGLIAWFDGTNNANGIMDLDAEYWKDLSGNANHLYLSSLVAHDRVHWSENALMIHPETGAYAQFSRDLPGWLEDKAYTFELVLGDVTYDATESITLLSSSNGELSLGFDVEADGSLTLAYRHMAVNTTYPTAPNAEGYLGNCTLAVTSDPADEDGNADGRVTLYSDGVALASERAGYSMILDYLYLGHTDPAHRWGGEVHGFRFYNRVLAPEELAANAQADRFNYREGNQIDPVERYFPIVCPPEYPSLPICGYSNSQIIFKAETDPIPTTGFYGSVNLEDYLYPYESDEVKWDGARLIRTGELETDVEGSPYTGVQFRVMYDAYCNRVGVQPLSGEDVQYMAVQLVVDGEIDSWTMTAMAYDKETNSELHYSMDLVQKGMRFDRQNETQWLVLDMTGVFDECDELKRLSCTIEGMDDRTCIYLEEIAFFDNYRDACVYAGIDFYAETETAVAETDVKETSADSSEGTVPPKETSEPTETTREPVANMQPGKFEDPTVKLEDPGCGSVLGLGAAVLTAVAAAWILRKKDSGQS